VLDILVSENLWKVNKFKWETVLEKRESPCWLEKCGRDNLNM
jgi:hypothetical protein